MLGIENNRLSRNSLLCPRTILIACNVKQMSKDIQPSFSAEDIAKIKKFSKTRSKVWVSFSDLRVRVDSYGPCLGTAIFELDQEEGQGFSSKVFGC